jgi:hypothetical protein
MGKAKDALEKTKKLPPQTKVEIRRGYTTRRTAGGIPVHCLHYSANPDRDPELHPEWKHSERKLYTSQASWDREQEIIDEAGGGELVFADTLITHWDKIVITAPDWRPRPQWDCYAGMDYGKTNPTVLLRAYVDHDGTIYFCGEYYVPGLEVWQHAATMKGMADVNKIRACWADPSIFYDTMEQGAARPGQAQERAKSINQLYVENEIPLFSKFSLDRMDTSFAARLMLHWSNLEERAPSVKIVCRNYSEKPQPGLHNWNCPNLLWELMRTRRVKLSAQQLLSRNASEAIVDKDNHARDAMKYVIMSLPQPTTKTLQQLAGEAVAPLVAAGDLTSANIRYQQKIEAAEPRYVPATVGHYARDKYRRYRPRWR